MNKKSFLIISILILFIGTLIGIAYYTYNNILNIDTIYSGVQIEEYSCQGKTKSEAVDFIKREKQIEDYNKEMKLFYEDYLFTISLRDIDFSYDYNKAVELAYEVGREGNLFHRFKTIRKLKGQPVVIQLETNFNRNKIEHIVENISTEINRDSSDAVFDFNNGDIKIKKEVIGIKLNKKELAQLITNNIYNLDNIDLPIETINPKINEAFYNQINGVIGEFSTSFKGSGAGRIENIKLSAKSLNGIILLPGEELSYNETTGPRQEKFGYKEAPVIVGGELVPGIGGGVCQTSTTLYNVLLLADLNILERHHHSIPPSYINKGEDAVVANGYLDLRFRNDFEYPIYIHTRVSGDRVFISIYGNKDKKDYLVKIDSEVVETIYYTNIEELDNTLAPGTRKLIQQGRNGYKVNTYKSIIKDGKVISKNRITSDYYKARNNIYKVGPTLPLEVDEEAEDEVPSG